MLGLLNLIVLDVLYIQIFTQYLQSLREKAKNSTTEIAIVVAKHSRWCAICSLCSGIVTPFTFVNLHEYHHALVSMFLLLSVSLIPVILVRMKICLFKIQDETHLTLV